MAENVPLFKKTAVDDAAAIIAAELKPMLDPRNYDSPLAKRLLEACPTLRVGDEVLATLKALHLASLDVIADMAELTHDTLDDDE